MNFVERMKTKLPVILKKLHEWFTGSFAGIIASRIITTTSVLTLAAVNVPAMVILIYSVSNELPVFEAYKAVKNSIGPFTTASVLLTLFITLCVMSPGIAWLLDPASKDLPWSDKSKAKAIHDWTMRRWFFAFVPGLALLLLVLFAMHCYNQGVGIGALGAGLGIVGSILVYGALLAVAHFRNRKKGDLITGHSSKVWRLNFTTYAMGFIYGLICMLIFTKLVSETDLSVQLERLKSNNYVFAYNLVSYAFLTFFCLTALFYASIWAASRSYLLTFGFVALYFFMITSAWPGASALLRSYMRGARLGGGAPIVLTANKDMSKNWPELFEADFQSEKLARSKVLLLVLLGEELVFVKPSSSEGGPRVSGSLMVKRSDVHDILFLSSETLRQSR